MARDTAGRLYLFRGRDGLTKRTQIGSGWQNFTAIFSTGDFDGDGTRDVLARHKDGRLMLYRGNGRADGLRPARGSAPAGRVSPP